MTFSIIIAAYNVEAYLPKCIESLITQSFSDWQAIIVDDGSIDKTGIIAENQAKRDSRFVVFHQVNKGQSAARNVAINVAKGDYILFLDSDDWFEPNALQTIADELTDEDLLCFSGRRYFEESSFYEQPDTLIPNIYERGWTYYENNALKPRNYSFVCVALQAYKRLFLERNHIRFKEGVIFEDELFMPIVYYYAHKTKVINKCLCCYRIHHGSTMTSVSNKRVSDKIIVANKLAEIFVPIKNVTKTTIYRHITHLYQVPFINSSNREREKKLLRIIDWKSYYFVSRSKFRHRIQFIALFISPCFFRFVSNLFSEGRKVYDNYLSRVVKFCFSLTLFLA